MTTPEGENAREVAARIVAAHEFFFIRDTKTGRLYLETMHANAKWTTDKKRATKFGPRAHAEALASLIGAEEGLTLEIVEV